MASLKILTLLMLTLQCFIANYYCAEERRGNVMVSPASINDLSAASSNVRRSRRVTQITPAIPVNTTQTDSEYQDVEELAAATAAVADNVRFDWVLTKRVASSSKENFLLPPLGVKLALGFLTEAATGATKAELSSLLGFETDRYAVRKQFTTIIESLQKQSSHYNINFGSKIYVEDTAPLRQYFTAISQQFYQTDLTSINFQDPVPAAGSINAWVGNITHGRIKNLVNPDDLSNMVMMIINTMFFQGSWRHQFDPSKTKEDTFYCAPKLSKPVLFMNIKDKFDYAESTTFDAKILRMPYLGNKYAMYIIVPNSLTGLKLVIDGLDALRPEMDNLQERLVKLTLPKYQISYSTELVGVLKEAAGIHQAFSDLASFPGIARGQTLTQRLRISKVLQRSGIDVSEFGSAAYFSTETSLVNKFVEYDERSVEVTANRPFIFFIQDENTRQLLFTGRVSDPSIVDGSFKNMIAY